MDRSGLGKEYKRGDVIVRQGETGDCMYVVQHGQVEVVQEKDGKEYRLSVLGDGEVFGEMSLFDREPRSATVRALDKARVLTLDKRTFLRRVHEDPSLAFSILQKMSRRIREVDSQLLRQQQK